MKKSYLGILLAFLAVFLFPTNAFASTLHLSPGSATIGKGQTTALTVRVSTGGDSINTVAAYLSYPKDIVEIAYVTYGGSAFGIAAENSFGGGAIRIARGNINGLSGNLNVATIGVKGLKDGKATISFIAGSGAPRASDSSDSLNLGGSTGSVVTVDSSYVAPTSAPKKAPVISALAVSAIATNSADISWKTDVASDSVVEFGLERNRYILDISDDALVTTHKMKLVSDLLEPGATIHYRVKSTDKAGATGISNDQAFELQGYTLTLNITNDAKLPLSSGSVTLYDQGQKRTLEVKNGEVSFEDVSSGNHVVLVSTETGEKSFEVAVEDTPLEQTAKLQLVLGTRGSNMTFIYGILGLVVLAVLIIIVIGKKRFHKNALFSLKVPPQNNINPPPVS